MFPLMGGDHGEFLDIMCTPDSTFKSELDALVLAKTAIVGKLVQFTFAANYQVTSPAANAIPDGEIIAFEEDLTYGYVLTCRIFHYPDQNSGHHTPKGIKLVPYESTLALQDSMKVYNSDYDSVTDGTTGGWGACIAIDSTNSVAEFLV